MRRIYPSLIIFSLFLVVLPIQALAHPGRTAADGCHYCRTNCDYWGVSWNERHCHNAAQPIVPKINIDPPAPIEEPIPTSEIKTKNVTALVVEIVDGDTFKARHGAVTETIRIVGIDTPETKDPRKPVQCFGKEATEKLKQLIDNKNVQLVQDVGYDNIDKYGRLLRYVHVVETNQDLGAEMVKQGYAYVYTKYPSARMNTYVDYQKEASAQKRGLWAPDNCDGKVTFQTSTATSTADLKSETSSVEQVKSEPLKVTPTSWSTAFWIIKTIKWVALIKMI